VTEDKDHYKILELAWDVSQEEMKHAYRRLTRELHPDANPGDPEKEEQYKEVTAAYDTLGDPIKRAKYDLRLGLRTAMPPTTATASSPTPTHPPDRRPLPPRLDSPPVNFEVVEHDNDFFSVIDVKIHNPNGNPDLQPVVQPLSGQFWEATFGTDRTHFFVSMLAQETLAPDVYEDSLEVYWEGIPDLTTTLEISLTIKPRPFAPPRRDNSRSRPAPAPQPSGPVPLPYRAKGEAGRYLS